MADTVYTRVVSTDKSGNTRIRYRRNTFYADNSSTMIRIDDEAGPWLAYAARAHPKAVNSALASAGWKLRKELQDSIYRGKAGSTRWPRLSDVHRYGKIDDLKERRRQPRTWAYGRLVKAVAYHRDKQMMRVRVGWLSKSAARLGTILQSGEKTGEMITEKERGLFHAAGVHMKKGRKRIDVPPRPLMQPVWDDKKAEMLRFIEKRIWKKIANPSWHWMG